VAISLEIAKLRGNLPYELFKAKGNLSSDGFYTPNWGAR
jgi:hypothetical protein